MTGQPRFVNLFKSDLKVSAGFVEGSGVLQAAVEEFPQAPEENSLSSAKLMNDLTNTVPQPRQSSHFDFIPSALFKDGGFVPIPTLEVFST